MNVKGSTLNLIPILFHTCNECGTELQKLPEGYRDNCLECIDELTAFQLCSYVSNDSDYMRGSGLQEEYYL